MREPREVPRKRRGGSIPVSGSRPRVLVTGVGGRSVGHQILSALLLLGDKYDITCTDADPFSYGLYEVPKRYVVPSARESSYVAAVLGIVAREQSEVLLPGTEAEIRVLVNERERLRAAGCHLVVSPADVIELCSDKGKLSQWLADNGYGVPKTASSGSWKSLASECGFPLVAKPASNSGGSRNVAILANDEEVARYIETFPGKESEIVFQEYVGNGDSEYTVGVVIGSDGNIIDSIVMHRKLTGLSLGSERTVGEGRFTLSTGYSQGFIVKDAAIQEYCEALCKKMDLMGPANIQLRRAGSEIKVFEVHPRFSGTTYIRAQAGFNEPDVVIRDQLFGERPGRQHYVTDVAAIRAFRSILVPVGEMNGVTRVKGND